MALAGVLGLDGVVAVCRFHDDGSIMEAAGSLPRELTERLGRFAHWYRRLVSGNTDLLSLFSQMQGWAPSRGWIVQGAETSICSMGNLACMVENGRASLHDIMQALAEAARE